VPVIGNSIYTMAIARLKEAEGHQLWARGHRGWCGRGPVLATQRKRYTVVQNFAFWCCLITKTGHLQQ